MTHLMPELPEVETVRRGLQPAMEGARVGSSPALAAGPNICWPISIPAMFC
jgi:formamidopyrimidine-DNA glycosylase